MSLNDNTVFINKRMSLIHFPIAFYGQVTQSGTKFARIAG